MTYSYNPLASLGLDKSIPLDGSGKIPSDYLPSYVDDVVEYDDLASFPGTGETGKIYVAKDTGYTYRWTGSVYVRIGSGGEVELNLGSKGSPSLYFTGDTNTGIYSPDADQLAISTGGTGRLFVNSSGNVGIGTSSPTQKLHVTGTVTGAVARIETTGTSAAIVFKDSNTGGNFPRIASIGNVLALRGGTANDSLFIDSLGNVGIGTQSPGANLDISSSSNTTTRINCGTSNASILEFTQSASRKALIRRLNSGELDIINEFGDLRFWTASDGNELERARIDSAGRLLVGTSSARQANFGGAGFAAQVNFVGTTIFTATTMLARDSDDTSGYNLYFGKTRNTTPPGAFVNVAQNDELGQITFGGANEGIYRPGAQITALVDGEPSTGGDTTDMPGRLVFSTTADGASTPTEQLRITSDRYVRLASGTGGIQFNGDTAAANALDDYEEGTFTPTLLSDGGVSITLDVTAEGYYRKIGSIVHMWGTIKTTTNLNSANYYQLGTAFTSTLASATHVGTASSSTNAGNANQKSVFSVTSRVSGGLYFVRVSPDYDFSNEDGFSFFISTPV